MGDAERQTPDLAAAYARALAAETEQQWWTAYSELGRVVELSPSYKDATREIARVRDELERSVSEGERRWTDGDLDGAIASFRRAGAYRGADERAAQAESTRTVLEVLYSQMAASAATGQWDTALQLSRQIIGVTPRYRDVPAKRSAYLDQLYRSATASLDQRDIPQAVRLFAVLVGEESGYRDSADRLAQAQSASRRPLSGAYEIGRVLRQDEWTVTLRSVIVRADGRITVAVTWRNETASPRDVRCRASPEEDARAFLTLADGTRSVPLETSCSTRRGETTSVPAGGAYTDLATYAELSDATRPLQRHVVRPGDRERHRPRPAPMRAPGDRELALIAILAGVMWSIGAIDVNAPSGERVGLLVVGIALGVAAYARREVGLAAGLYAVAIGGVERLQRDLLTNGSDVLRATQEGIAVLLRGQDPYDHVFVSTRRSPR